MVAVYLSPSHSSADRKAVYAHISSEIIAQAKEHGEALVLAGDWNAAAKETDRPSSGTNTLDSLHQKFLLTNGIKTLPGSRAPTSTTGSRIDDILNIPGAYGRQVGSLHTQRVYPQPSSTLDHYPLVAELRPTRLGIVLPPRSSPLCTTPTIKLRTPIPKEAAAAARDKITHDLAQDIEHIRQSAAALMTDLVATHWQSPDTQDARNVHILHTLNGKPAQEVVDGLSADLLKILNQAQQITMQVS